MVYTAFDLAHIASATSRAQVLYPLIISFVSSSDLYTCYGLSWSIIFFTSSCRLCLQMGYGPSKWPLFAENDDEPVDVLGISHDLEVSKPRNHGYHGLA